MKVIAPISNAEKLKIKSVKEFQPKTKVFRLERLMGSVGIGSSTVGLDNSVASSCMV